MAGQSYTQLISPLIFLVFACGFFVVWRHARELASARVFALSYFFGACGFTLDYFRLLMTPVVATYATNIPYIATAATFSIALCVHYRRKVPWLALGATAIAVMAALTWFRFVDDNILGRTFVMNAGAAVMIALPFVSLRWNPSRIIDRFLMCIVAANAVQFSLRAAVVLWYEGTGLTQANYAQSPLAISLHFGTAVAALAIAAVLFIMFGMEIVERLTLKSHTDPLTGLLNRRGFDARADALSPGGSGYGFVIADIDHFKSVNDTYGHEAGDAVIARFAKVLRQTARPEDIVARWGGEEFVIVIANGDTSSARLYAETIRSVFELIDHPGPKRHRVTASFGVGSWRTGEALRDVYKRADGALYEAKQQGRNRVRMAGGETAPLRSKTAVA